MASDGTPISVHSRGATLAVYRDGDPSGPTVVLVHGFPDDHSVWDRAVPLLSDLDVVRYDVRGAGASSVPGDVDGYRIERLVDDLAAVIDAVRPDGEPVHLVGHDWGSVQLWAGVFAAAEDPRLTGRLASFTSISGPDLRLYGGFLRAAWRDRRLGVLCRQLAKSWYVGAFQVPRLPEAGFDRASETIRSVLRRSQRFDRYGGDPWGPDLARNASNGVNLYRANAFRQLGGLAPEPTDVPVTLVVPTRDDFLSPELYEDLPRRVPELDRVDVDAGHWMVWTHPERTAEVIRRRVAA
ncbi:pimeloyl-ACP methyl ester carboxylesterase [Mumia flava]|uniref:Pimeloyl-ACP methyl ester carboxylesterase n=1 Tax=Mumia flava TaxID=1348852 RepID=A0A0B2B651_9ACTN|nr:alpha/beta fold hydrolase [Mumia flava]PJJ58436.1 pimeloyl-ACP methyl ester carboxylesterase [Mumia flava]